MGNIATELKTVNIATELKTVNMATELKNSHGIELKTGNLAGENNSQLINSQLINSRLVSRTGNDTRHETTHETIRGTIPPNNSTQQTNLLLQGRKGEFISAKEGEVILPKVDRMDDKMDDKVMADTKVDKKD